MLKRLVILLVLVAVFVGIGYALRPLSIEHTFSYDQKFGRLEIAHRDWGGVSIAYDYWGHAHILVLDKPRIISPGDTGPSARIVQEIYLRFFPPAISSTPPWCTKNMEDEVVGPGELLITAETYDGQPFCDYIFELQRLDGGEKFTISNLDSGGNTSVLQWDGAGVYAITFRSADGEVLCAYELTYQPELGNIATCFVPDSLKRR